MYKNAQQRQHFLELARLVENNRADNSSERLLELAGETIYRDLLRVERKAHRLVERCYIGPAPTDKQQKRLEDKYTEEVARILGYLPNGFFINGDPRGYTLKIEGDSVISYTDQGGYHILAPNF